MERDAVEREGGRGGEEEGEKREGDREGRVFFIISVVSFFFFCYTRHKKFYCPWIAQWKYRNLPFTARQR